MKKTTKLIAHYDRYNTGETGLVASEMNIQDDLIMIAMEGRMIAHDVLEHVNGVQKIGACADELEAMGAVWYIRGQHGQLIPTVSSRSPQAIIGDDISQICIDYIQREYPNTGRKIEKRKTKEHCYDADFEDIIERGYESTMKGIQYYFEDEELNEKREMIKEFFDVALGYLRTGYRKAERKYKNKDVFGLFWKISETIDQFLRCNELFDGMQFTLHYGLKDGVCYANLVDETEYGY